MKKILISMMMLVAMSAAHAQQANDEFTKEVNRTIEISNVTETFINTMTTQMQQFVDEGILTQEKLATLVKEIEEFAMPLVKNKITELCKENFSLEEMKQINAYLATPLGQKSQRLFPKFTQEGSKLMQTPEAQEKIKEIVLKYFTK